MMAACNFNQLRCLLATSLLIGCLAKIWAGALFNFNVYTLALRDTFNYTQTDINTMAILTNVGLSFCLPAGILHDKYGPRLTTFLSLILSFLAYILIWSTSKNVEFYRHNAWLLKLYYFFLGQGTTFMYMSSFVTNISNFESKYRGKVVGLLDSCFGGSPTIFALVYATCFVNGHITDDENQNWPGYIVVLLVGSTITYSLCVLLLRVRPDGIDTENEANVELRAPAQKPNTEDTELVEADELGNRYDGTDIVFDNNQETKTGTGIGNSSESGTVVGQRSEEIGSSTHSTLFQKIKEEWYDFKGTLFKREYLCLLFVKSFVTPIAFVYITNITAILKAARLEQYSATMTILFPFVGIGGRIIIAIIADCFPTVLHRSIILLVTNMGFVIAQALLIGLATDLTILFITTILISIAISCSWSLLPVILSDLFPMRNFGRNWGAMLFMSSILSAVFYPFLFGAVYDAHTEDGSRNCYGLYCTQLTFIVTFACSLIGLCINVALVIILRNKQN
ncbi:unnamed protein product [Owenia fusiformis]|uniref:Uncharacterized protein n=1 Tax=Owenia fusiformis TaxID=6347 RepID=A0A8J1U1A2_OWEFU|nr:unnamed protein product [Owenia fusiformis]